MKSLLIDALRRAKLDEPEQVLSDSGSFDSTHNDFSTTANDEAVDTAPVASAPDADAELELLESTGALVVHNDRIDEAMAHAPSDEDSAGIHTIDDDLLAAEAMQPVVHSVAPQFQSVTTVPLLVRYSPLFCVVLAITASASWLLYQTFGDSYSDNSFGVSAVRTGAPNSHLAEQNSGGETEPLRFPYIELSDGDTVVGQ